EVLVVGLNSDASVRRLKGVTRPINDQASRARVLGGLACVDAVTIFEEDTPDATIEVVRPHLHIKGGDYIADDLSEAATVKKHGGRVEIVALREGFSTTSTLKKLNGAHSMRAVVVIPARFGSTRFPGKPLKMLGDETLIVRVTRQALQTRAERPLVVATDDERIAGVIQSTFDRAQVEVVMTSAACHTGTDRIAQAVATRFSGSEENFIIVNVQGDEPFVNPGHLDALIEAMQNEPQLEMATLAAPIRDARQVDDPNVVKVVCNRAGLALYFSRCSIPFVRDEATQSTLKLRHFGVYAYRRNWLNRMAALAPTRLEDTEKLEQLRALEHGVGIRVLEVDSVIDIAIDTPEDLARAEEYLRYGG
ncbi:MAG: 3-deoxy-manno-octulosonate cytidylyltransferase synthetase, partial [Abditibacteriota bacterium]|nr:3-deoxy-manno-octulosonate cytidylyltransferase synthetase [Abditibacteriota bacterium]